MKLSTPYGLVIFVAALVGGPVILDLAAGNAATPFRYFAADAFYYFVVARNFAQSGMLTFDQLHPTNGFHPLWQLFTGELYQLTLLFGLAETAFLTSVAWVSMIFVMAGIALAGIAFIHVRGRLPVLFVLAPVGIYALLLLPVWIYSIDIKGLHNQLEGPTPLYGTMWSFMNGMESGLVILFFGLLFLIYTQQAEISVPRVLALGFVAGLLVLSRLDHIFFAGGLFLLFAVDAVKYRRRPFILKLLLFSFIPGSIIFIYMLANYHYANAFLPVSGTGKSTFPVPNLEYIYHTIWVLYKPFNDSGWLDRFYRITQIIIPCFATLFMFWWARRVSSTPGKKQRLDTLDTFLLAMGVGVLGLAGYNFFFVQFYGPGHWYFPISILYTTLVFINVVGRFARYPTLSIWKILACGAICLLVFFTLHKRTGYHDAFIRFYFSEAAIVQEHYRGNPPKLIEYDDGIIAFATGFPTMSGFGLALDQEAFDEAGSSTLTDVAYKRGFNRVTSLVYKNFSQINPGDPEMKWFLPLETYNYTIDYASGDDFFGIIKIHRKEN